MKALVLSTSIAKRSGIVTASTRSSVVVMGWSDIVSGRAERKRKDTERDGTERKRKDATSPLAGTSTDTKTVR